MAVPPQRPHRFPVCSLCHQATWISIWISFAIRSFLGSPLLWSSPCSRCPHRTTQAAGLSSQTFRGIYFIMSAKSTRCNEQQRLIPLQTRWAAKMHGSMLLRSPLHLRWIHPIWARWYPGSKYHKSGILSFDMRFVAAPGCSQTIHHQILVVLSHSVPFQVPPWESVHPMKYDYVHWKTQAALAFPPRALL